MTTDDQIISVLETLIPAAVRSLSYQHMSPRSWPEDVQDMWTLSLPLRAKLSSHPDFSAADHRCFLGKQFNLSPTQQAVNVLRIAAMTSAAEALAWYRRVVHTRTTSIRVVGVVFGLNAVEPIHFSNGLTLMNLWDVPDSANVSSVKSGVTMRGASFPAAIVTQIDDVDNAAPEESHRAYAAITDEMRKVMNAFALSDQAAPIVTETWQDLVDPDLQAAETALVWQLGRSDGALPYHPHEVTAEAIEWVERFLHLSPDAVTRCELSLERLNMARRRLSAGDQALDGCISLEALLSGKGGNTELTHRLSVRVALLLGKTLADRQGIFKRIKDFYRLRSTVVHGSSGGGSTKEQNEERRVAADGLQLCLLALREIVANRAVPQPEDWELCGGPPWNRYQGDV